MNVDGSSIEHLLSPPAINAGHPTTNSTRTSRNCTQTSESLLQADKRSNGTTPLNLENNPIRCVPLSKLMPLSPITTTTASSTQQPQFIDYADYVTEKLIDRKFATSLNTESLQDLRILMMSSWRIKNDAEYLPSMPYASMQTNFTIDDMDQDAYDAAKL